MEDCIFCKIATKEIPANVVWENERFTVFADIKPVNPGHLLIIPKGHVEAVFDLADDRYAEAFMIAKTLVAPLLRATGAKRIGIVVEGFDVPHAHIKLIPLHKGDDLDPHRARTADPAELAAMAERIKSEIRKG